MSWDTFKIERGLIGEAEKSGEGYYVRERKFITLPENDIYDAGYGFYVSSSLAGEYSVSLPDDYKVELQMSPAVREPGRRYKRYKLTGEEIKETVFVPYQQKQAEQRKQKEKERAARNKKVVGKIVYGRYTGNTYEGRADYCYDAFFYNGVRYYNPNHQKVQNVKVAFTIVTGVSKYLFDERFGIISERLATYRRIEESLGILNEVKDPSEKMQGIIAQLEEEKDETVSGLRLLLSQDK